MDPDVVVGDLPRGRRQRAENLKALCRGAEILILDEPAPVAAPVAAPATAPEDRRRMGLVTRFPTRENMILGCHRGFAPGLFMDRRAMLDACRRSMADFDVRPPNPDLETANFSGGNQQKIAPAREIGQDPAVLIVGQPARGVDVGAIETIHRRLIELRDKGRAILPVSVGPDEIRALSDRVLVMFDGRVMGELPGDAGEREIGLLMSGVEQGEAA